MITIAIRTTAWGGTDFVYGEKPIASADVNDTFNEVQRAVENTSTGHDHDGTDSKMVMKVWNGSSTHAAATTTTSGTEATTWTYSFSSLDASNNILSGQITHDFIIKTSNGAVTCRARILITDSADNLLVTTSEVTTTSAVGEAKTITITEADLITGGCRNKAGYKIKFQQQADAGETCTVTDQVLAIYKFFDTMPSLTITGA